MKARVERCSRCKFWCNPRKNEFGHGFRTGDCQRFPPVYVLRNVALQDEEDCPHDDRSLWGYPVTCEDEWCGEWKHYLTVQELIDRFNRSLIEEAMQNED